MEEGIGVQAFSSPTTSTLLSTVHKTRITSSTVSVKTQASSIVLQLPSYPFCGGPKKEGWQSSRLVSSQYPTGVRRWTSKSTTTTSLYQSLEDDDMIPTSSQTDEYFDPRTTLTLIVGQSSLIAVGMVLASLLKVPNYGFGAAFSLVTTSSSQPSVVASAVLYTLPLGVIAILLDRLEDRFPALKDVSTATQRSVLALLGGTFKPILGLLVAFALGTAAGLGEELLFRGILQFEFIRRLGMSSVLSIGVSSVVFGLLHAVTPLYALLATIASVYFGTLFLWSDNNLAVPIVCHALYDVVALMVAHWQVSRLSDTEREEVYNWSGPSKT